jgi:hypothetical protein
MKVTAVATFVGIILLAAPLEAGTLTVRGGGDPLRLTIVDPATGRTAERTEDQPFVRGLATFQDVPAGRSLFLGVVPPASGAPAGTQTRARISRFTFDSVPSVALPRRPRGGGIGPPQGARFVPAGAGRGLTIQESAQYRCSVQ